MKNRLTAGLLGLLAVLSLPIQAFAISPDEVATADIRKLVDVKSIRGARGAKRVAVPGYRVIFTTRTKVVARAEDWLGSVGNQRSSGSKATMEVVLGNVDFATVQAIADAAYADFIEELKAGGIEVVPLESVLKSAAFQKMKMTGSTAEKPYTKRSRDRKTDYLVASPTEIPLWFTNFDGDISDQGMMSQTNMRAIMEMSKELDALMIFPLMHIDFATVGGSGGKFARRASVQAKAAVYANPAYTLFYIASDKGGAFARMNDGIGVEGDPGDFVTADQSSNAAFIDGMQKIGIDFGPVKSKKNMVLQANRENFQSLALDALKGTNEAFRRGLQEAQK
ncbi:MAG TPA: hypothetical protein VF846_22780 [Thermoanaerobaculia bacterium]|jgi:hypothetical protein